MSCDWTTHHPQLGYEEEKAIDPLWLNYRPTPDEVFQIITFLFPNGKQ
jgi:hypothetical protein